MKPTTLTPLAASLSGDELRLQKSVEVETYKNKKENLRIQDRLDLRDTALYGEQLTGTLNATTSIALAAKAQKAIVQKEMLEALLQQKPLNAEKYAQAA